LRKDVQLLSWVDQGVRRGASEGKRENIIQKKKERRLNLTSETEWKRGKWGGERDKPLCV